VRLEFLARRVALSLQRLARGEIQPQKRGNPLVDRGDERVPPVEVARLARPVICYADVVGDLGWPAALVDAPDQLAASVRVEKAPQDEEVELRGRYLLDAARVREALCRITALRGRIESPSSSRAAG
jgi:hypothetical protein